MGTASTLKKNDPRRPDTIERLPVNSSSLHPAQMILPVFTAIMGVATIVLLIAYLVLAISFNNRPFLGVMLSHTLTVNNAQPVSNEPWPGLEAGLTSGDQVRAVNGQQLSEDPLDYGAARANYAALMSELPFDAPVTLTIERPETSAAALAPDCTASGDVRVCTITVTPIHLPASDFLAYFILPYGFSTVVAAAGILLVVLRRSQTSAMLVALICFLMTITMSGIFDAGTTHTLLPLWLIATAMLGGMMMTFGMVFPMRMRLLYKRAFAQFVPLVAAAAVAIIAVVMMDGLSPQNGGMALQLVGGFHLFGLLLLAISMYHQRRFAVSTLVRDQANTILIGTVLVFIPSLFWLLPRAAALLGAQVAFPFTIETGMVFMITVAVSMVYSVLQYRRFDTDKLISEGIVYLILLVALVLGYALLVFGPTLFAVSITPNDTFVIALTIFGISVLFLPVRNRLQQRIDKRYFRVRRNNQERAEEFARQISSMVDAGEIVKAYQKQVNEALAPTSAIVFLPDSDSRDYVAVGTSDDARPETDVRFSVESGLVKLLQENDFVYLDPAQRWPDLLLVERARLTILRTLVIAALKGGSSRLNGFVCIGPPRSNKKVYDYEELRLVSSLARQMALAIERAQVIESLQKRVRELDVISRVSQAVNFAVQYDDLLELINNQTDKLIPAAYFYVVLRDRSAEQLYFAFFLENEERFREKENHRFPIGRDLYSDILRRGQAIRLDDFAAEMARRNMPILYEDPHLKAWMGVPLIAGTNNIGVMVVANKEPRKTYSDDQLKIFSDIGALAATSLERARLFAETDRSARQLKALNEVSQKLVAAEQSIDTLLELITSSAVTILDSEAGSLLLTAEDDSGDLEFKVVIGATGQELIGQRLPSGKGLVGEVAETGHYVIVNDAANDPRWGGEMAKGTFHTDKILAAPLIAKDTVIGVLEVLNKKDGTNFVDSDVELLTTFASQAAIAIENARLFQMTDIQLAARVKELEALERIDVELNRARDPQKVAEITLRWAIANTGASAGVVGLLQGTPAKNMRILAAYGYEKEDLPKGATEHTWPIDRGIISRVMRTRRADLAADLSIDPDYEPALRDSKSQITIPMTSAGEITAILILESRNEPRLSLVDMLAVQRITDHASIAIDNARLYKDLTEAIESKSEFMGFAAHELKNPLQSVRGFADLLRTGKTGELTDLQHGFIETIYSNANRMEIIISDLRDAAALEANKLKVQPEPISFYHVVIETLRPFQTQLNDKHQTVINNINEQLPLVLGDSNRLIQVMTNLISNAHKYSPEGSTITLNAHLIANPTSLNGNPPSARSSSNLKIQPVLHITVEDNGIGMSEEDLKRIFQERYFRSENEEARQQPGTGLGMMITQKIVELHGGKIWVESKLGEGTTFHFTIPIAKTAQIKPVESAPEIKATEPASD